jgi:hypothetical protein
MLSVSESEGKGKVKTKTEQWKLSDRNIIKINSCAFNAQTHNGGRGFSKRQPTTYRSHNDNDHHPIQSI